MNFIEYLELPTGLFFQHIIQSIMFIMMEYILVAEYVRTKREDLIFKLFATSSIILINLIQSTKYFLEGYLEIHLSNEYFPIFINSLFVIVVLMLAKAFVYEFINNKKTFDIFFKTSIVFTFLAYGFVQYFWSKDYKNTVSFGQSKLQFFFALYFIVLLLYIIYSTIRYRKKYRLRLTIAFMSIIVVQLAGIYNFFTGSLPVGLFITKHSITVLVPIMFGSVMFKELIEKNNQLTGDLKNIFASQKILIFELNNMSGEVQNNSSTLFNKAGDTWLALTEIKSSMEKLEILQKHESIDKKITDFSREIEEMAALSDSLNALVGELGSKSGELKKLSESISYINK